MLASYYDDTVNWAFSSKAKNKNIAIQMTAME